MSTIEKHFPADTSMEMLTFLNNKNIDGRLYAYLQSKSMPLKMPDGTYETRVDKFELVLKFIFIWGKDISMPQQKERNILFQLRRLLSIWD